MKRKYSPRTQVFLKKEETLNAVKKSEDAPAPGLLRDSDLDPKQRVITEMTQGIMDDFVKKKKPQPRTFEA